MIWILYRRFRVSVVHVVGVLVSVEFSFNKYICIVYIYFVFVFFLVSV